MSGGLELDPIIAKARKLIEILEKETIKESPAKSHHPRVTVCNLKATLCDEQHQRLHIKAEI